MLNFNKILLNKNINKMKKMKTLILINNKHFGILTKI
jgi:hypothetical protein